MKHPPKLRLIRNAFTTIASALSREFCSEAQSFDAQTLNRAFSAMDLKAGAFSIKETICIVKKDDVEGYDCILGPHNEIAREFVERLERLLQEDSRSHDDPERIQGVVNVMNGYVFEMPSFDNQS